MATKEIMWIIQGHTLSVSLNESVPRTVVAVADCHECQRRISGVSSTPDRVRRLLANKHRMFAKNDYNASKLNNG